MNTFNPITLILLNVVYRPIFNIIVILLALSGGNLGLSIILLTIIIRLLLLKPSMAANNMQKSMVDIQPRMKEIQERYKDDPQKLGEETMKLMKSGGGAGMLTGCKMMLIQLPVFLGLFYVIRDFSLYAHNPEELAKLKEYIYSFLYPYVHTGIDHINGVFLGVDILKATKDLGMVGVVLTLFAGFLMWIQIKLTMLNKPSTPSIPTNMPGMPKMPDMNKMMGFMNVFMVFMMMVFVFTMPAGIGLYIITTTLFTIVQYSIQYKELLKIKFKIFMSKKNTNLAKK